METLKTGVKSIPPMQVAKVPAMSYEEAQKTISWWKANKRGNSLTPPHVKVAMEVLGIDEEKTNQFGSDDPYFVFGDDSEHEQKSVSDDAIRRLDIRTMDFNLIEKELSRCTKEAQTANEAKLITIKKYKQALYDRRDYLKKNGGKPRREPKPITKKDVAPGKARKPIEDIISEMFERPANPQEVPQESPKTAMGPDAHACGRSEIFQESEKEPVVIPQKKQIALAKPIGEFNRVDEIQAELDRLSALKVGATAEEIVAIDKLMQSLWNRRYYLKNRKPTVKQSIKEMVEEALTVAVNATPTVFSEDPNQDQPVIINRAIYYPEPTKVVQFKRYSGAICTFSIPSITCEVHDVADEKEALIQAFLRQAEALARKELASA